MTNRVKLTNNLDSSFSVNSSKFKKITQFLLKLFCFDNTLVSISLVDEDTIKSLNKTFRNINRSTDVLSFPQETFRPALSLIQKTDRARHLDPSKDLKPACASFYNQPYLCLLGDIELCPSFALKSLKDPDQLSQEIAMLIIHSFLHLCGHDHANKQACTCMFTNQLLLLKIIYHASSVPMWQGMIEPIRVRNVKTTNRIKYKVKKG